MTEQVFSNAFVSINGVDLSDHLRQATLNYSADMVDITAMGDGTRNKLGGLKDWSMELEFNQDHAAANVDATLFPLVGTSFTVILRPTASAVSATNPNFTGTALLESYTPLTGPVGDVSTASVTLQGSGDLTRATS